MKWVIFVFLPLIIFLSCCNYEAKRVEFLQEEVMRVHDSIMPLSGELMRLKRECTRLSGEDSLRSVELVDAALALDAAYFAMMEWMQEYMVPDADASVESKLAHFEDEMRKIRKVGRMYDSSMQVARELLRDVVVLESEKSN
jgi:hypothetical protein